MSFLQKKLELDYNIVLNWKTKDKEKHEEKLKERKMRLDLINMIVDLTKEKEIDYRSSMQSSFTITKTLSKLTDKLMKVDGEGEEIEMIKHMGK